MTSQAVNRVLDALKQMGGEVNREGSGKWKAHCPTHVDSNPSLSISEGSDGRSLIRCHAGCSAEDIVSSLGLEISDLFEKKYTKKSKLILSDLADSKMIPEEFLKELEIKEYHSSIKIPYRSMDGLAEPCRQRRRTALSARDGSSWYPNKGNQVIVPYGLDRLTEAYSEGFLVLVEGESDCWTLWHHGFPALGIPGANSGHVLKPKHLDRIDKLYLIQETDDGGKKFIASLNIRLRSIGYEGEVYRIQLPSGMNDVNDLHKSDPDDFKKQFDNILLNPIPMPIDPYRDQLTASPARLKQLNGNELKLLLGLHHAQVSLGIETGQPFKASYSWIKDYSGIPSDSTIRKWSTELEKKGYLEILVSGRNFLDRKPNEYCLIYPLPKLPTSASKTE